MGKCLKINRGQSVEALETTIIHTFVSHGGTLEAIRGLNPGGVMTSIGFERPTGCSMKRYSEKARAGIRQDQPAGPCGKV